MLNASTIAIIWSKKRNIFMEMNMREGRKGGWQREREESKSHRKRHPTTNNSNEWLVLFWLQHVGNVWCRITQVRNDLLLHGMQWRFSNTTSGCIARFCSLSLKYGRFNNMIRHWPAGHTSRTCSLPISFSLSPPLSVSLRLGPSFRLFASGSIKRQQSIESPLGHCLWLLMELNVIK